MPLKDNKQKVLIFGASNVAIQFAKLILDKSDTIDFAGFCIRRESSTEQIKKFFPDKNIKFYLNKDNIPLDCDFYILAVSDNALDEIIKTLPELPNAIILHTAGAYDLANLTPYCSRVGVLYPLQSISKNRLLKADDIPVFLEVLDDNDRDILQSFAGQIFTKVYWASSSERDKLHLSAVFSANFSNYLYSIAYDIAEREGVDPKALTPLIKNVALRLEDSDPRNTQTGPAERKDFATIDKHLSILRKYTEDYSVIYKTISDAIIRRKK